MNHITSLAPTRYTQELARIFAPHANSERAPAMAAYMRNHFAFFGIMSGPHTALTKEFIRQHGHPGPDILPKVVQTLWQYPEREFQYAACELLIAASKTGAPDLLPLVEHCITHKSWWDTVDTLAPRVAGDATCHVDVGVSWAARTEFTLGVVQSGDDDRACTRDVHGRCRRPVRIAVREVHVIGESGGTARLECLPRTQQRLGIGDSDTMRTRIADERRQRGGIRHRVDAARPCPACGAPACAA